MKNRPIIAALKSFIADAIEHARLFVHTNTFKNCLLFGVAAFASNLDAAWLDAHPTIKTWLPPALAAFTAVSYKVAQQVAEKKQNG